MTADTVILTNWFTLHLIIELEYLFRADPDAQAASFAPQFVYCYREVLCQKNHLPPPSKLHITVRLCNYEIVMLVLNRVNISKKYAQIKSKMMNT
jgi:hypothetical protein